MSKARRKKEQIQKGGRYSHSRLSLIFIAILLILLSASAYFRSGIWKDELTLWKDVVRKSPEKARGYNNFGLAYHNKGHVKEGIREYLTALKLDPRIFGEGKNILDFHWQSLLILSYICQKAARIQMYLKL